MLLHNLKLLETASTVSYVGFADGMPHYQNNLFQNAAFPSPCYAIVSGPTMVPQMFLERLNHSNNQFETFSGPRPVSQSLFTHVPHGTYRLKLQVPRIVFRASCDGGHIPAHYSNAQHVGWMGHFSEVTTGDTPGTFFSDEVVVGMTTQADISFTFIDEPETGPESAYDYLEGGKINTSQCKNYNRWMIAIIEDGPLYNRYMSTGFLDGKIGGGDGLIFDLTDLWQSWVPQWQFEPFHTYTVQVVLENQQCPNPSWNQLMRTFFVCPTGTGCRLGKEEVREITMGPNPAHSSVWLYNFNPQLE